MAERVVPAANSLVKYDNPVLVSKHPEKISPIKPCTGSRPPGYKVSRPKTSAGHYSDQFGSEATKTQGLYLRQHKDNTAENGRTPSLVGKELKALPPVRTRSRLAEYIEPVPQSVTRVESAPCSPLLKSPVPAADDRKQTEEILNAILPPREWEEGGQLWRQQVSSTPATRLDVINLQEQLDMRLLQRQARETGICPVRRELYTQCFDELIRQITINCGERGLLLLRVRDEIRMTISAYQILYESSVAFGIRKALMAEQGKADLEEKVDALIGERSELEKQVVELRARAEQVERRSNEQKLAEEKKHAEEIQFLKRTNQQLKAQLEGIIAPKK